MIPLRKLEQLPRHQRLRKAAKIFAEAERVFNGGVYKAETLLFFADAAGIFAVDPLFAAAAAAAFREAEAVLRQAAAETAGQQGPSAAAVIRRSINAMRHILLAETGRSPADWDFIDGAGQLDSSRRRPFAGMTAYLEDIRSPFNVGAMFRTAESFGAEKLYLSPLCADPRHPRALRSAMGCVEILPWERRAILTDAEAAAPVFALETGGTPLAEFPFPQQGLLIAGSEELGVSPAALAVADASLGRVTIPVFGAKGSLNVSAAFAIVMQAWAAALAAATAAVYNPHEL